MNNFSGTDLTNPDIKNIALELLKEAIRVGALVNGAVAQGVLEAAAVIVNTNFLRNMALPPFQVSPSGCNIMPDRFNSISEPR